MNLVDEARRNIRAASAAFASATNSLLALARPDPQPMAPIGPPTASDLRKASQSLGDAARRLHPG